MPTCGLAVAGDGRRMPTASLLVAPRRTVRTGVVGGEQVRVREIRLAL